MNPIHQTLIKTFMSALEENVNLNGNMEKTGDRFVDSLVCLC